MAKDTRLVEAQDNVAKLRALKLRLEAHLRDKDTMVARRKDVIDKALREIDEINERASYAEARLRGLGRELDEAVKALDQVTRIVAAESWGPRKINEMLGAALCAENVETRREATKMLLDMQAGLKGRALVEKYGGLLGYEGAAQAAQRPSGTFTGGSKE